MLGKKSKKISQKRVRTILVHVNIYGCCNIVGKGSILTTGEGGNRLVSGSHKGIGE